MLQLVLAAEAANLVTMIATSTGEVAKNSVLPTVLEMAQSSQDTAPDNYG
jgi:hypothetical protein